MTSRLGLDVGTKRVGVAVCPEGVTIAMGLTTLEYKSRAYLAEEIKKLIREYQTTEMVIGLPKTMKGEIGPAALKMQEFVVWLKTQIQIPIELWDERLSSKEAERILLEADVRRDRRKEVIDQLAAQRILQTYIDSKMAE